MKNSVKLTALFLLFSTGLLAAVPHKDKADNPPVKDQITFTPVYKKLGVDITILKQEAGKSVVRVYDWDNNLIMKDEMLDADFSQKGYMLDGLDNGNYLIEVTSNGETVNQAITVYDEDDHKNFFFMQ